MNGIELKSFARDEYSQTGEDGIIEQILSTLPETDKWCVEFGAWDGMHLSNTFNLIKNRNYKSVLIEADREKFSELEQNMAPYDAVLINEFVMFEGQNTLENLLARTLIPTNFDFLSIDIDGNDYWILESIKKYRPKVVCIEFNPSIPNAVEYVQPRDFSIKRGSSASSIYRLAREKSYEPLAATDANLLLVDQQYFPLFQVRDNTLDAIRDDSKSRVYAFTGFDGTLIHSAPLKFSWHGFRVEEEQVQVLPRFFRKFYGDFGVVRKLLFLIYLFRWDAKTARQQVKRLLGKRKTGNAADT